MPSSSVLEKEAAHEVDGYLYGSFPYSDFWDEVDQKDVVKIVDELKTKYSLDNEDVRNYMGEIGGAGEDIMPEVEAILNPNISALPRRPPPAADDFETALGKLKQGIQDLEQHYIMASDYYDFYQDDLDTLYQGIQEAIHCKHLLNPANLQYFI